MKKVKNVKNPLFQMKKFLRKNPRLSEALRIFDISYDQYQKAINSVFFYSSASTSSLVNTSKHKE